MPLAITLGYLAKGRTEEPKVLYCGLDAGAADAASLNPPPGIRRTELFKFPTPTRRREFPNNLSEEELAAQAEAKANAEAEAKGSETTTEPVVEAPPAKPKK